MSASASSDDIFLGGDAKDETAACVSSLSVSNGDLDPRTGFLLWGIDLEAGGQMFITNPLSSINHLMDEPA